MWLYHRHYRQEIVKSEGREEESGEESPVVGWIHGLRGEGRGDTYTDVVISEQDRHTVLFDVRV